MALSSEDRNMIARKLEGINGLDRGYAQTLLVAALAYQYDCRGFGEDEAWSRLPVWEQQRVREASRYFLFVQLPEGCPSDEGDDDIIS
jgi:hypothetical protein